VSPGAAGFGEIAGTDPSVNEPSAAVQAAIEPGLDVYKAVQKEMLALMSVSRREAAAEDLHPGLKRRRLASGASSATEYTSSTVSTAIRALYEDERDWARSEPLAMRRKGWRSGRFESFGLRALERFALTCDGGGLSLEGIEKLWDLLDTWDGTKPGMPMDDGHNETLHDAFNSVNAFKHAIRDDVDDDVLGAGWRKCRLVVDGQNYDVLFRPVLQVNLDMLARGKEVRLWSGDDGPAPPSNIRETPLDGDAFRLNEAASMEEKKDGRCFVLGLHVFSDAS